MKRFFIRGPTIFAILFVALIFSLAVLIAPTTIAIAATTINDQITAQDATARHGPGLVVAQSEKNFKFYEVAIGSGPGQKSEMDLLGANKLDKKYNLKNDTAVYTAGPWGYHPMAG